MAVYPIAELPLGNGWLGIGPMPGRSGACAHDVNAILRWGANLVLSMTTSSELERAGLSDFDTVLADAGIDWRHLPVPDFRSPPSETALAWPEAATHAQAILAEGGRVFAHCYGGCGRSGMALMRLMVEAGEDADRALIRLRDARPCAVETDAQKAWAAAPMYDRLRRSV